MSRRKRHDDHENHEAWAIPYGDLVTLLLAFFVVMYAMSSVNEGKYRVLSDSLSEAFTGAPRSPHAVADAAGTGNVVELPRNHVRRLIGAALIGVAPAEAKPAENAQPETQEQAAAAAAAEAAVEATTSARNSAELGQVADQVGAAMGSLVAAGEVHVRRYQNWVAVDISTDILFGSGTARLSDAAVPPLQRLADALKPFTNAIRVEGHTDNRPIRTVEFPSNWELSAARAASVVRVFMDRGVEPGRLAVMGFGEYRPKAPNQSAAGRNANRRVAVIILDADSAPDSHP